MSGGEGSRGGKIIGHSASGRPVYAKPDTSTPAGAAADPSRGKRARVVASKARADVLAKAAAGHDPHPGDRDHSHQGVTGGGEPKLRLHGNLDRPAVFNKPGYRGR